MINTKRRKWLSQVTALTFAVNMLGTAVVPAISLAAEKETTSTVKTESAKGENLIDSADLQKSHEKSVEETKKSSSSTTTTTETKTPGTQKPAADQPALVKKNKYANLTQEEYNNLMGIDYSMTENARFTQEENDYNTIQIMKQYGLDNKEKRDKIREIIKEKEDKGEELAGGTKTIKHFLDRYDEIEKRAGGEKTIMDVLSPNRKAITTYRTVLKDAMAKRQSCTNTAIYNNKKAIADAKQKNKENEAKYDAAVSQAKAKGEDASKIAPAEKVDVPTELTQDKAWESCPLPEEGRNAARALTYITMQQENQTSDSKKTTETTDSTKSETTKEWTCQAPGTAKALNNPYKCCPTANPYYKADTNKCVANLDAPKQTGKDDDDDDEDNDKLSAWLQMMAGGRNGTDGTRIDENPGGSAKKAPEIKGRKETVGQNRKYDKGSRLLHANYALAQALGELHYTFTPPNRVPYTIAGSNKQSQLFWTSPSGDDPFQFIFDFEGLHNAKNFNPDDPNAIDLSQVHYKINWEIYVGSNNSEQELQVRPERPAYPEKPFDILPPNGATFEDHIVRRVPNIEKYPYKLILTAYLPSGEQVSTLIPYLVLNAGSTVGATSNDGDTRVTMTPAQWIKPYADRYKVDGKVLKATWNAAEGTCDLNLSGSLTLDGYTDNQGGEFSMSSDRFTKEGCEKLNDGGEYNLQFNNVSAMGGSKLEDNINDEFGMTKNGVAVTDNDVLKEYTGTVDTNQALRSAYFGMDGAKNSAQLSPITMPDGSQLSYNSESGEIVRRNGEALSDSEKEKFFGSKDAQAKGVMGDDGLVSGIEVERKDGKKDTYNVVKDASELQDTQKESFLSNMRLTPQNKQDIDLYANPQRYSVMKKENGEYSVGPAQTNISEGVEGFSPMKVARRLAENTVDGVKGKVNSVKNAVAEMTSPETNNETATTGVSAASVSPPNGTGVEDLKDDPNSDGGYRLN